MIALIKNNTIIIVCQLSIHGTDNWYSPIFRAPCPTKPILAILNTLPLRFITVQFDQSQHKLKILSGSIRCKIVNQNKKEKLVCFNFECVKNIIFGAISFWIWNQLRYVIRWQQILSYEFFFCDISIVNSSYIYHCIGYMGNIDSGRFRVDDLLLCDYRGVLEKWIFCHISSKRDESLFYVLP